MTDAAHEIHGAHAVHAPPPPRTGLKRWTGPGWYRARWLTPRFGAIGALLVVLIRWAAHWDPVWKGVPITTVELTVLPLGFLAGIGGFDYWVRYCSGKPTILEEDHSGHGARTWKDYF